MYRQFAIVAIWAMVLWAGAASAATVPFLEHFDTTALWEDTNNNPLSSAGAGGPDGSSFVSTTFNFDGFVSPFGGGPVLFRAAGSDGASGGAFIGDWLAEGISAVTIWLRHDASLPMTPFLRVAGAANFPGAVLPSLAPVAPGDWTQVVFPIDVDAPWCVGEGVSCADAFSSVFNLQFGTDAPAGLTTIDQDVVFDLDRVQVVPIPEPGAALLVALGLIGLGVGTRARR